MPGTFSPPTQPSFVLEIQPEFSTAKDSFEGGYVQTRIRWHRKKRRFRLSWENADDATRRYVSGFIERQLGAASAFSWQFPTTYLYQPEPPLAPSMQSISGGTKAQRTYYVVITFANANGETRGSPRDSITIPANELLRVQAPRFPAGVTQVNVYVSTTSGDEREQAAMAITTSLGFGDEPTTPIDTGTDTVPTTTTLQETVTLHVEADTYTEQFVAPGIWNLEFLAAELFG